MFQFTRPQQDIIFQAIEFIRHAHAAQTYADGPYYLHPIEVAETIEDATFEEYMTALFHDIVEDTDYTVNYLQMRFDPWFDADAVVLVSKDKSLTYAENIQRIIDSKNVTAMKVKLADNKVNHRSPGKPHNKAKYEKSMDILTVALRNYK